MMERINKSVAVYVASALGVAERWKRTYFKYGKWESVMGGRGEEIYKKLCELGDNPSVEDAAKIIGNKAWTHISCGNCSDDVLLAVKFGQYENEMTVCGPCLQEAVKAIKEERV